MRCAPLATIVCLLATSLTASSRLRAQDGPRINTFNPFATNQAANPNSNAPPADAPPETVSKFEFLRLPTPRLPKWTFPSMPKMSLPKLSLFPNSTEPIEPARNRVSTWEKMNQHSRKLFNSAKSTLMPWAKTTSEPNRASKRQARVADRPKDNKRNLFSFWGSAQREDDKRTVNNFLTLPPQDRPNSQRAGAAVGGR